MPDGSQLGALCFFGDPLMPTIEEVLSNWARWSRTKRGKGHCASIEHRFRTPNHFYPPSPNPAINLLAALAVEREMQQMPRDHQRAIIMHYVDQSTSTYICRKLAIRHVDWSRFLADAVCMISNRLRRAGR
jgi:DNA-directed RNA polymerase specialized sigma24 family protein